jgi:Zn-finger nucleic acid-binding protein
MSRACPRCHVPFGELKKPFATLDACPQCGGIFLDPGEGAALHGADSDPTFLVKDGKARLVGDGELRCPSEAHPPRTMRIYAIGGGDDAIEIDACPACGGVFLDRGEDRAIEARISGVPASPFEAPPRSNQEIAIAELQASADERPGWRQSARTGSFVSDLLGFLGGPARGERWGRRHRHR